MSLSISRDDLRAADIWWLQQMNETHALDDFEINDRTMMDKLAEIPQIRYGGPTTMLS